MIFVHNPYTTKTIARFFISFSSFAWANFGSFFLWFMLAFSQRNKILKKAWFYLLLIGIPLVFIYLQWANLLINDFIKEWYGWKPLYSQSTWSYLFALYFFVFMGMGFYININFMRTTRETILKKQAAIIFITSMITFILGASTDIILPLLNIHVIPNIADFIVLIWASGAIYAMVKYRFLTITPAMAADNIISTMHDCLILLNLEGNIVTVNEATLDLLGYKEDELKGAPVGILFAKEELKMAGKNFKNKDLVFKTKKGKEIPVLFSSSVLTDETGAAGGIVCVAKDISERKRLLEEIYQSKKLDSIGILAGGIAHDFNNLLSVIMGNISLALKKISPQEKAYKFLVKSEKASLKAADLAGKFVTFSRGGWLIREKVILANLLKNMKDAGLPGADANVSYDIDLPGFLMPIYGDEEQLTYVLQNLFFNAVEAVPEGGKGTISLRAENAIVIDEEDDRDHEESVIKDTSRFLLQQGKRYVKILIQDNGIGIPRKNIRKIFDPYFSTKDKMNQEGMGLGLTICYSIIKKHEGHITVESEKGKGTTAILYLPVFVKDTGTSSKK